MQLSLRYELEKKSLLEQDLIKIKEEVKNIKDLASNTLSNEEEKVLQEYYEQEKEKKELSLNVSALKSEVESIKENIELMEKEFKINDQEFYKKQKE